MTTRRKEENKMPKEARPKTEATHIVIKIEDAQKYLNGMESETLDVITRKICDGRLKDGKKLNSYFIVNQDEPYSRAIHNIILIGEARKEKNK